MLVALPQRFIGLRKYKAQSRLPAKASALRLETAPVEKSKFDADTCAAVFAGFSFLLAAFVFWRDAQIRQFEIATRLSEDIERRWDRLNNAPEEIYDALLIDVLNHYERCALLLNDIRIFKSRAMKGLEKQIFEALHRNWSQDRVQNAFRNAYTSDDTYCEIRELMQRNKGFGSQ